MKLDSEIKRDLQNVFSSHYKRKLKDNEVENIALQLTNFAKHIIEISRNKNKNKHKKYEIKLE